MASLDSSELYGDQYRVRVASPEYSGHCLSWDYPLAFANASNNGSLSPDSSLFLLDDEYHRVIYFSGKDLARVLSKVTSIGLLSPELCTNSLHVFPFPP